MNRTSRPAVAPLLALALLATSLPAGAGWMVADAQGAALAFLPTSDAAATSMSERF